MITIVLQGALNQYAVETAKLYIKLPFVEKIILSCWTTDEFINPNDERIMIWMSEPVEPGIGNRNLQIKSSYEGLKLCTTEVSVKMRNDQRVRPMSMYLMHEYYQVHKAKDKIFVAGMFPTYPFHPRDHIFWGATENLLELFNIPYDTESLSDDYTKYVRSETYIAMHYYASRNHEAARMISDKENYLLDFSPHRQQAISITKELDLFKPFPRISMAWPKYKLKEYYYEYTKQLYGEYQAD